MLTTSLSRSKAQAAAWLSLASLLAVSGCGTAAYEERLDATVTSLRAGAAPAQSGEAAEPPAVPAAAPADAAVPGEAAAAAEATNASGQGGVVGRMILAPTDALP